MKTANLNPPGAKALDIARGRVGKRAGTPGSKIADAQGNEVVAPDQLFIGATVSGEDGEQAVITISGTGQQATNAAGATLEYGDVVVQNADGSVSTTTTAQDTRPVGVVQVGGADGEPVSVVFQGYVAQINTTASVTAGNYAETSTTDGQATENATPRAGSFGRFLATGANPPATLFGQTYLTGGGSGGGGGTGPEFNIRDYGALGDGSTDDRTAVNLAIAAMNAAGGGELYIPMSADPYITSGAFTTITVPCIVRGDGKAGFDGLSGASQINCTSATAALFTFTPTETTAMMVRDLGLANTAGSTPSAGGAIVVTTSDGLGRVDLESVSVHRFYDNIDIQGVGWTIRNCYVTHPVRYGIRVRNVNLVDGGDWSMSDTALFAGTYDSDAAIRIESSGGAKIVNVKVNEDGPNGSGKKFNHGIDLAVATSVSTSILLVTACSFENIRGDGIHGTTSAATSKWGRVQIINNQFALFSNTTGKAISLVGTTAGDFYHGVIMGNTFHTSSTARSAMQLTKTDNFTIGPNVLSVFNAQYTSTTNTNLLDYSAPGSGSVATDTIWDAAGDLAVGSGADTAARLAKGVAGAELGMSNGAVTWTAGTSFPGSPATGDRYYRTDGVVEYAYDGTRWVCTCAHYDPMPLTDASILPLSATQNGSHRMMVPLDARTRVYSFRISFFVSGGTALSGSHKWVIVLKGGASGTTHGTITIDSGASSAWRMATVAVDTTLATGEYEIEVNCTKTGTPGNLYITPTIDWRIVGP